MSFLRHREIYRSDGLGFRESGARSGGLHAPTHRFDEFPAGYSLAGCAPAEPASASPAEQKFTMKAIPRPSFFQRMGKPCLAGCLTSGVHRVYHTRDLGAQFVLLGMLFQRRRFVIRIGATRHRPSSLNRLSQRTFPSKTTPPFLEPTTSTFSRNVVTVIADSYSSLKSSNIGTKNSGSTLMLTVSGALNVERTTKLLVSAFSATQNISVLMISPTISCDFD